VSGYREFRFWCPQRDGEAVRLSMVDDRNREFFAILVAESGKRWRERREAALTELEDAISCGATPGEIVLTVLL
jgi:hypothetical protein